MDIPFSVTITGETLASFDQLEQAALVSTVEEMTGFPASLVELQVKGASAVLVQMKLTDVEEEEESLAETEILELAEGAEDGIVLREYRLELVKIGGNNAENTATDMTITTAGEVDAFVDRTGESSMGLKYTAMIAVSAAVLLFIAAFTLCRLFKARRASSQRRGSRSQSSMPKDANPIDLDEEAMMTSVVTSRAPASSAVSPALQPSPLEIRSINQTPIMAGSPVSPAVSTAASAVVKAVRSKTASDRLAVPAAAAAVSVSAAAVKPEVKVARRLPNEVTLESFEGKSRVLFGEWSSWSTIKTRDEPRGEKFDDAVGPETEDAAAAAGAARGGVKPNSKAKRRRIARPKKDISGTDIVLPQLKEIFYSIDVIQKLLAQKSAGKVIDVWGSELKLLLWAVDQATQCKVSSLDLIEAKKVFEEVYSMGIDFQDKQLLNAFSVSKRCQDELRLAQHTLVAALPRFIRKEVASFLRTLHLIELPINDSTDRLIQAMVQGKSKEVALARLGGSGKGEGEVSAGLRRLRIQRKKVTRVQQLAISPSLGAYGAVYEVSYAGELHTELYTGLDGLTPAQLQKVHLQLALALYTASFIRNDHIIDITGVIATTESISLVIPEPSFYSLATCMSCKDAWVDVPHWQKILILQDIASGLEALHAAGTFHSHLSTGNIILNDSLRALLTAATLGPVISLINAYQNFDAEPNYCAPEAFGSRAKIAKPCDVYSFAVVMWEVLTSEKAWEGHTADEIRTLLNRGAKLPEHAAVTQEERELMEACWELSQEDRPTITDVVQVCVYRQRADTSISCV
ncbi:unnamed protein product [Chrysoparadoxa australica]